MTQYKTFKFKLTRVYLSECQESLSECEESVVGCEERMNEYENEGISRQRKKS